MERKELPFRKNTEGYFLDENNQVLALDSGKGYPIFPGGGVDDGETPEEGMVRELFEETGAIINGKVINIGVIRLVWGEGWAKTEKQKERYEKFQGDEMHFFCGMIAGFSGRKSTEEDVWQGEKLMPISRAIQLIESGRPFDKDIAAYREMQLKCLKSLQEKK
ncbi:MAG: NUDIX domain-containing protein [Candidatus Woesearchaeota archaeon]